MSLTAVNKKIKGVIGRDQPTGHTLFKSWDSLASAMKLIWDNARIYNEDGSDIYNVSLELEVWRFAASSWTSTNSSRTSSTSVSPKPGQRSMSLHNRS